MDVSKLPKLSRTDPPPPPVDASQQPAAPQQMATPAQEPRAFDPLPGIAEAWISIVLGIILLVMFPNTISYVHSRPNFEQYHPVTDEQGNPIPYVKSAFFWTDLGVTIFAAALILEGVALVSTRQLGLVYATLVLTVLAVIFNLIVSIYAYPKMGAPIWCMVAVAIGGYMAITQWRMIAVLQYRARVGLAK